MAFGALLGLTLATQAQSPLPAGHPPVDPGEGRFLSRTRQLTYDGLRSGEGYFSPDGTQLIFQSERESGNPFYQIYRLDLASGDIHRISPGSGKTTCAFFRPRSGEVLFASTHLDPETAAKQQAEIEFRASGKQRRYSWDYDSAMDIFSARRDGSNLRRLTTTPGYDAEAAYSPDGRWIVFTSLRDAFPLDRLSEEDKRRWENDPAWFGEIYVMKADGTEPRRLTRQPGYDGGPFFSPDGRRIVWRRFDETGVNADVYTMKTDGSDVRRVTDFGAMSWAPFYHPSGRYLIFTANKLGFSNFELFIVDSDGAREPVRVTFTDGFDGLPVFAPEGERLCWTSGRGADGKSQLYLAAWNHAAALAALEASPRRGGAGRTDSLAAAPVRPVTSSTPKPVGRVREARPPSARRFAPEVRVADLQSQVRYLASDALEGRATGTEGSRLAGDWLIEVLRRSGVQPGVAGNSYAYPFEFIAGVKVRPEATRLSWESPGQPAKPAVLERDFRPLAFSSSGEVDGEVVFAGYGLTVPGKMGEGYDSYAGLDVSNRLVLVLRYVPEGVDAARRQELNRYAGLRYKAMMAREHGARGLLVVTGPNSPNAGGLIPLGHDSTTSASGIPAVSVSGAFADALLRASGRDLKAAQDGLDTENPHAETGFALTNARVKLQVSVESIRKSDRNIVGIIPPGRNDPDAEYVLIGAHYDHLGHGEEGSLQNSGEHGQVHNGADDNASGTAAVVEMAAALAAERKRDPQSFRRGVIVALWSGEEIGLLGSTHFADKPPVALNRVAAYLNFDMVGRLRDNRLVLQGLGSSPAWRPLIERRNVAAGFDLRLQDDPYLPTDVTALYSRGVPGINFFTGGHPDYHRPTDDPDRIDYDGLERIGRFALDMTLDLVRSADRPAYAKVEHTSGGGSRDSLRAYLGTIPDYAAEGEGVKLSGVRAGSPAEKAGLRGGDVIVEFAGKKIVNIYDYTYGLDAVKIGQPVQVIIVRGGSKETLTVTPEARK